VREVSWVELGGRVRVRVEEELAHSVALSTEEGVIEVNKEGVVSEEGD